jgi:hypothetical protein
MKTLASLLLVSATVAATAAYALGPSGELDYPPAISQITSLSRAQVMAEFEAAKAAGRLVFGEIDEPSIPIAESTLSREQVRAEAVAAHANGSYSFGELDYKAAFSVTAASRS